MTSVMILVQPGDNPRKFTLRDKLNVAFGAVII